MFGLFKKKKKKFDDFDNIKDRVLGEPAPERFPEERFGEPSPPFLEEREPPRRDLTLEPLAPPPAEPMRREMGGDNYEVVDRLKFIESQLSAIRSQLELINERLKHVENKFRRGY